MNPNGWTPTSWTTRWVGKIWRPGSRDETSTAKVCVGRRLLLAVGDRGLVAVVAVGDQERHVEVDPVRVEPPEPAADAGLVDLDRRVARRPRRPAGRRRRAGRSARARSSSSRRISRRSCFDLGVRLLVRQHLALGVRRRLDRADDALAGAADAVGPVVLLGQPPERRLLLDAGRRRARQSASVAPGVVGRVRPGQVDDVVRARVPEPVVVVLRDHVVGRRDEIVERPGDALVVAERAKRVDRGHGRRLPKRLE